jgi:hypothetical protein
MLCPKFLRTGRYQAFFLLLVFLSIWLVRPLLAGPVIMPLSQVKPGMKGIGKSVFTGRQIQEFNVEILGILENVQPKQNWILARLTGQGLENTGVIAGMSGSPSILMVRLLALSLLAIPFLRKR